MINPKRFAASLAVAACACLLSLSAAAAPTPAAAQSCQVTKNEGGQWEQMIQLGQVATYGDLKIRLGEMDDSSTTEWLIIDVKAPGLAVNGYKILNGQPVKFTACGQDVTLVIIVYGNGPLLRISVF